MKGDSGVFDLLIVFLAAILLTIIALPLFRTYTLREHNKMAEAVLEDAYARARNWRALHPNQRLRSLENLGYPAIALYVTSDGTVRDSANLASVYRISLSFPTAATEENCGLGGGDAPDDYVLIAEPIQTQRIDSRCGRLCLAASGRRGSSGAASVQECWQQ
jgi:Tfp pilus assembly protein PilE